MDTPASDGFSKKVNHTVAGDSWYVKVKIHIANFPAWPSSFPKKSINQPSNEIAFDVASLRLCDVNGKRCLQPQT